MKFGFLFGAGAEVGYGLPSGGMFALDIFRYDSTESKKLFKEMRDGVDLSYPYATEWLPDGFMSKNISSFGKTIFQNIIQDTVEHNRDLIIEKLNSFDDIAKTQAAELRKDIGINIDEVIKKMISRDVDTLSLSQSISFITEFEKGNNLFANHYFAALLMIYKNKSLMKLDERNEMGKILLSLLQLLVGALSEELARKINDSLFNKKDEEIDLLDDLGEFIQLNYSSSGIIGMEYMLEMENPDLKSDPGIIIRFAQMVLESIYSSVLDYKSIIDSYWHYLYSPKKEWAKFCKICIFLLNVRNYISEKSKKINLTANHDGYYNMLRESIDKREFECTSIATTNYNHFIEDIIGTNIIYLNGSTETWYDPYINRIGTKEALTSNEKHILVPLMFTQSGTKPMTSISMSEKYVGAYQHWKDSDALVVIGFGFGVDDEHINGIIRTLIDIDNKKVIVITIKRNQSAESELSTIKKRLKIYNSNNLSVILVNEKGIEVETGKKWTESIMK